MSTFAFLLTASLAARAGWLLAHAPALRACRAGSLRTPLGLLLLRRART